MGMGARIWVATLLLAALFFAALKVAASRGVQPLRDPHSEPALRIPAGGVAVIDAGKVFHKPQCRYLHGAPQTMSGQDAVRAGYSPCVRCEHESRAR